MTEAATQQGAAEPQGAAAPVEDFDSSLAASMAQNMKPRNSEPQSEAVDEEAEQPAFQDGGEPTQADDAKEAKQEASTADTELVVKIDGQEKRVKQSELIAHYQKGEAASKRFEEAATVRRAAEQAQAQIAQERTQLGEALQHYAQQLQSLQQAQQPDWDRLLQEDPTEFQRQRYHHEQRQAQLQQAQAAQAYLMQQQAAEQAQQVQRRVAENAGKLLDALPDWKDSAKATAEKSLIRESLAQVGFSADEIEGLIDHRMVLVARKAALFDRMQADQAKAKTQVTQKLANLPPPRVERPGVGDSNPTDGRLRAMKSLNKTGSLRDAASVLQHLL